MRPAVALSDKQLFGYNILPQNDFKIRCEPEEGLAKVEKCRSAKQNTIWFRLDYYNNLCINLLKNATGFHGSTQKIFSLDSSPDCYCIQLYLNMNVQSYH